MQFTEKEMKTVYGLAWSFHRTTGIELEELVSEGFLAICECECEYRAGEGAERNTFLHRCITSHLRNYIKKNFPLRAQLDEVECASESVSVEDQVSFKQELERLSPSAKQIAKMIFESPADWLEYRPKMAQGAIRDTLRAMGWKYERIWNSMREVKQFVRARQ